MKVTINDVAKEAGVSKATVSRVISNNPAISEDTRKMVLEVIERMGYKPNQTARNLARNKTRTIGLVFPIDARDSFGNPIYIQMMQGISQYAQENEYYLMYAFGKGEEEAKNIKEFTDTGMVDGIIILKTEDNDKLIKGLRERKFPFVVIGRPGRETTVLWVDNDNFGATYEAVQELVQKGYKKIAFVGAKPKWTVTKDRLEGYKRGLEVNGIAFNEEWLYIGEEFNESIGHEACKKMASNGQDRPQAVITTDDLIALGFERELEKLNIDDMPVVGFNNTIYGAMQHPPISSIEIHGEQIGSEATKLLIDRIEGKIEDGCHKIVNVKLVKRGKLLD